LCRPRFHLLAGRKYLEGWLVFHFIFRAIGMVILALALVTAVLDLTRSIAASGVVMTSFAAAWESMSPTSFKSASAAIQSWTHPLVWDPMIVFVLGLPSWLVLWLIAMIFLWLGQKRRNPYGRFASR
jgi:hypothetical protein